MQIECPFCHSQARIPDSKEGARVRCGECEKVYTARDKQAVRRKRGGTQGLSIGIFVGAGVLAAVIFFALNQRKNDPLPVGVVAKEAPAPAPIVDTSGWNSAPVRAARALYDAAFARNDQKLAELLAAAEPETAAPAERLAQIAAWKPFDGEVLEETDERATVRISVGGRDPETAAETRQVDLRLVLADGAWKVLDWSRYQSSAELEEVEKRKRPPPGVIEPKVLSDGTAVSESEPGPIPYLDGTPAELRAEIDAACVRLTDFELRPKENAAAKAELVEIGAPALPALLTALYELPLENDEDAMRVNLVNQCLEEITGVRTGFRPQIQEGSALGTTAERRESSLRQWFAWWHREGVRFEARTDSADPLEGLIEPTEADLRQMEKDGRTNPGGSR